MKTAFTSGCWIFIAIFFFKKKNHYFGTRTSISGWNFKDIQHFRHNQIVFLVYKIKFYFNSCMAGGSFSF